MAKAAIGVARCGQCAHLNGAVGQHDRRAYGKCRRPATGWVDGDEHVLHVSTMVAVVPSEPLRGAHLECGNVVVAV